MPEQRVKCVARIGVILCALSILEILELRRLQMPKHLVEHRADLGTLSPVWLEEHDGKVDGQAVAQHRLDKDSNSLVHHGPAHVPYLDMDPRDEGLAKVGPAPAY